MATLVSDARKSSQHEFKDNKPENPLQGASFDVKVLSGPLLWAGEEMRDNEDYILHLSKEHVSEIDGALAVFNALRLDLDHVHRDNFPLPTLGKELDACAQAVHKGRGFCVIRGLDPLTYSVKDSTAVFMGIASYLADKRGTQDRHGNVLSHITSSKAWSVPESLRHGIHSTRELPFHNDMGCDVLALQVRQSARSGGLTCLSSSWRIFNDLVKREPEVVKTLLTPDWPVQLAGTTPPYYLAPLFKFHDGNLLVSLDPNRLGPHPKMENPEIPRLNLCQQHALRVLSEVALNVELQLMLEAGDLLFFNNWSLLHRRDAYEDEKESSRHMVRLWLRNEIMGWGIPESMQIPWRDAYGDKRADCTKHYPLMPKVEYETPKYSAGSAAFVFEDIE